MCGLAGFTGEACGSGNPEMLLSSMARAIAHRGPDGQGVFSAPGIGLAHVRLSIVGLADGQQPMTSADGRFTIVFNGEIFNYVELRDELKARGIVFRTGSDTEVLLQLYATYGEACLSRLNGDFAFAIWDARERRLMLARDRMGVRPLFYAEHKGALYFASEVKALLQVPGIEAELDPVALDQIFTLWAPIPPRTAFKNIFELEPGHLMIARNGRTEIRPYWSLDFPDADDHAEADRATKEEELRALLTDATRLRMRADVPVGAYLSGGLDSSLIAALAAPMAPNGLNTFSVTFDDAEHDESAFQMAVARALGTHHRAVACGPGDIAGNFPDVIRFTERPVLRTAPAPLYRLSGLVRDAGMKVVLTGEGADEVFAGYDIFREAHVRRFCARRPGSKIRPHLFRKLYPYLPGLKQQSADYLAAFFGAGNDAADDPLFSHRPRFRSTAAAKIFYSDDLRSTLGAYDAAEELASRLPENFGRWHPLHQAQYLETRFLLPGYILSSQGDRMAMAHGIEGRFPFLDHRLVEFASRLPPGMKLKGLEEKHVLRRVAKDVLPDIIAKRPKQPYRAPDSRSFAGSGEQAYVSELLSEEAITGAGLFNARAVAKLHQKCRAQPVSGFRDNAAFVGILSTQLWLRSFESRQTAEVRNAAAAAGAHRVMAGSRQTSMAIGTPAE
ncbi:asparagine synthase (glutamine-hydrolyzing) [Neorhizobium sp. DT-125]